MDDPDALVAALAAAADRAVAAGARAVCIGGGPLAGLTGRIGSSVPLIDPVAAAARAMARASART